MCLRVFQACARFCSQAFFCRNMCFRGSFSGGASAKDKGHRGHRERFFCSSGFQIIQGRREGASRPSFSPFLSLVSPSLIEFTSLHCHMPSVRRRPRPNQTFTGAPGVATRGGSIRRRGVRAPPERRKHKSSRRQQPRSVSPLLHTHQQTYFRRHRKNSLVFIVKPHVGHQSPLRSS